jgi:hypothetical protein
MWCLAILVIGPSLVGAACAPMKMPDVGEDEVNDLGSAYGEAVMVPCGLPFGEGRPVMTAELSVQGAANGKRFRGRVWVGTDLSSGSLRLESVGVEPPLFVFIANHPPYKEQHDTSDVDGSLFLPHGNGVVRRESSRALVETILGLPLSASEFMAALIGCPRWSGSLYARRFGDTFMKVVLGETLAVEMFVRRKDSRSPWTLVAMSRNVAGRTLRWRAEYGSRPNGLSRTVRIISQDWNGETGRVFDIRLSLSRIQIGPALGPETFSPAVPASAEAINLEGFRQQRPRPALPLVSDAPPLR